MSISEELADKSLSAEEIKIGKLNPYAWESMFYVDES